MSEEDKERAVVETTDAQAKPAAEGADARDADFVNDALKEFEAATAKPEPKPEPIKPTAPTDVSADVAYVKSVHEQMVREKFQRDMGETVKEIRGDLPAEFFTDKLIQAWIEARASDDPRLTEAWMKRDENPKEFKKVKEALSREIAQNFGKLPDKTATEDREAVAHAVRGASTRAPEGKPAEYSKLSNREFSAQVEKDHGFTPPV